MSEEDAVWFVEVVRLCRQLGRHFYFVHDSILFIVIFNKQTNNQTNKQTIKQTTLNNGIETSKQKVLMRLRFLLVAVWHGIIM